ncbi:hypothetical protein CBOM_07621 [Ceraceosorus bombacis]|uniref:Uncharacterized protein n=1 Tax=Ceraceosorus bombacis TaxID=401625 RepID=A0A0P1BGT6_9BASI|nr:hypothetical protein CBOM_07621 [Ceraceosorus bombacis]
MSLQLFSLDHTSPKFSLLAGYEDGRVALWHMHHLSSSTTSPTTSSPSDQLLWRLAWQEKAHVEAGRSPS